MMEIMKFKDIVGSKLLSIPIELVWPLADKGFSQGRLIDFDLLHPKHSSDK
jgi:hypothetical protein